MSFFEPVELQHASRLLYLGPTILVTSHDPSQNKRNVMAVGWSTPVETLPSRIAIVIDKSAWSRELITQNESFGICIPMLELKDLTYTVGSVTGRECDKFERYSIPYINGPVLKLPLIEEGCAAWLECKLLPEEGSSEKYDTLFGEVVSAAADKRVFSKGHWTFDDNNKHLRTLHYLGEGHFQTTGDAVTAKLL